MHAMRHGVVSIALAVASLVPAVTGGCGSDGTTSKANDDSRGASGGGGGRGGTDGTGGFGDEGGAGSAGAPSGAGGGSSGGGPSGGGVFGDMCSRAADCPTELCVPVEGNRNSCTVRCPTGTECLAGWRCLPILGQMEDVCQCTATLEICNGLDDDCNGIIDDPSAVDDACEADHGVGFLCRESECTCSFECGSDCVDPRSNPSHCGECGNACATGATCVAGECECPTGQSGVCNGACVDLASPSSCGACGNVCGTGAACVAGECECTNRPIVGDFCEGTQVCTSGTESCSCFGPDGWVCTECNPMPTHGTACVGSAQTRCVQSAQQCVCVGGSWSCGTCPAQPMDRQGCDGFQELICGGCRCYRTGSAVEWICD